MSDAVPRSNAELESLAAAAARLTDAAADLARAARGAQHRLDGPRPAAPAPKELAPTRLPLVSSPVRESLASQLRHLGSRDAVTDAFAAQGLPGPVPDDGRVHKSPIMKLISRYFDAIDWADLVQVEAVFALLVQALSMERNDHRRYHKADFASTLQFRNVRNGLACDGWLLTDDLRIGRLDGPAPVDEPAPERYRDPEAALEAAVHDVLSAAQTVRQVLGGQEMPLSEFGNAMTWQMTDASRLLLDGEHVGDILDAARDAFDELTQAAQRFVALDERRYSGTLPAAADSTTLWLAQVTCRAWAQAALELLEVARGHRRRPASSP